MDSAVAFHSSSLLSKLPYRLLPSSPHTFHKPIFIKSIHTPIHTTLNSVFPYLSKTASFSCFAVASSPPDLAIDKLHRLATEFESLEPIDRVKRLLHYSALLQPLDESSKVVSNRVMGCTSQVWLIAELDDAGKMRFKADSDSEISRGFCSCLVSVLDGAETEEVLSLKTDDLAPLSLASLQNSRVNTWHNVLISMHNIKTYVSSNFRRMMYEKLQMML